VLLVFLSEFVVCDFLPVSPSMLFCSVVVGVDVSSDVFLPEFFLYYVKIPECFQFCFEFCSSYFQCFLEVWYFIPGVLVCLESVYYFLSDFIATAVYDVGYDLFGSFV